MKKDCLLCPFSGLLFSSLLFGGLVTQWEDLETLRNWEPRQSLGDSWHNFPLGVIFLEHPLLEQFPWNILLLFAVRSTLIFVNGERDRYFLTVSCWLKTSYFRGNSRATVPKTCSQFLRRRICFQISWGNHLMLTTQPTQGRTLVKLFAQTLDKINQRVFVHLELVFC